MKYIITMAFLLALYTQSTFSQIIDANQISEYTVEVTKESGKSNLSYCWL